MSFNYYHLRAPVNHSQDLLAEIERSLPQRWGIFSGLFGLAANELYVVTATPFNPEPLPCQVLRSETWQATARPVHDAPLEKPGLYVFRRFHVRESDVEEVVSLSETAWQTFETATDYATQPMGLFRPTTDPDGIVRMQLVTWYDGFASWETSRHPAPEARENFQRRRDLTLTSYAVATRLVV